MSLDQKPPLADLSEAKLDDAGSLSAATVLPLLPLGWLGRPYHYYPRLDSTNSEANRLAEQDAPHGTVVVAEEQEAGRGRLGRTWHSPNEENLYLSAILRPAINPARAPLLCLVAAVGLATALQELLGEAPQVKWPNDLLLHGCKACGILLEMRAEIGQIRHVVLGVGLNINTITFPTELASLATSLRLVQGRPFSRTKVLVKVLQHLETWIDRFQAEGAEPILAAWCGYAPWLGEMIEVKQPHQTLRGVALGLSTEGGLRLRLADGTEQVISAGEVQFPGRER
jgi:BirA family transcriptional regulator, biotin operon repressor / biotin---[acetyl-CoA-carboxylase] ligase